MKGLIILISCVAFAAAKYYPSEAQIACAQEDSEGILVYHEDCNRFYNCHGSKPVAFNCPSGLVFNAEKQYCDWPYKVFCGDRPIAEIEDNNEGNDGSWIPEHGHDDPSLAPKICASKKSEGVLVAHENCSQYYQCTRGLPLVRDCPEGLFYHPEIEVCDWPRNVECGDRITAVNT